MSPRSSCRFSFRLAGRSAMRRLVLRLAPRLACRLVLYRVVSLVPLYRLVGRSGLDIVRSVILLYRHRPCVVPPRSSRLAMRGAGRLAFLSHVVGRPVPSCFLILLRLVPVRLRSSSFVVVGMGVSLRGACGEIELTKTAHFNALVISVSSCSCSCSCCVAMGIGPGRTGVRQGIGAGLFGRPVCRICSQVVSAN